MVRRKRGVPDPLSLQGRAQMSAFHRWEAAPAPKEIMGLPVANAVITPFGVMAITHRLQTEFLPYRFIEYKNWIIG